MWNKFRNKVNCRITNDVFTAVEVLELPKLTKCLLFFFSSSKLNFLEINVFPWKFFITTKCHLNAIFWWKYSVGALLTQFIYRAHPCGRNMPGKTHPGHVPLLLQTICCMPPDSMGSGLGQEDSPVCLVALYLQKSLSGKAFCFPVPT